MVSPIPRITIQLFAKAPLAGLAKTRLIPALGETGAAALAKQMLQHTMAECAQAAAQQSDGYQLNIELWATPAPGTEAWGAISIPEPLQVYSQAEGDLGTRMATAVQQGLSHAAGVILLGSDCPAISAASLHWAAKALLKYDSCMFPTFDGGYALLGLRRYSPRLFADIAWSTATVASETRSRLTECGMSLLEHSKVHDIDETADLAYLPAAWQ
ncbi:TIGR04282 family arsenosugar biosynthesis glycosyltransferase [Zhongshania borealis]|uniref:TIGR04282 family arsenosugar biosynthesis glycosyltransferase n=1 Tax=Zhongshania borealis TaxID=889488 RepID=A0ABP7X3X3_9GAMM